MKRLREGLFLIVLSGLFFMGCGRSNQNRVVLATPSPVDEIEKQIQAFNAIYPDIHVETLYMGVGELTTRIKAEARNPQIDVVSDIPLQYLIQNPDFFRSQISEHDASFQDSDKDTVNNKWYSQYRAPQVFIVNTNILPDAKNQVKNWTDLMDPKFKGEIIMANPGLSSSAFSQLHLLVTIGGWELVEGVLKNAVITPSSRLAYQGVADGEYAIGMLTEHIAYKLVEDDYPIVIIYPEDGINNQITGISLVENSPNSENARLFFDFLNSRESHEIAVSSPFFRRSSRSDVILDQSMVRSEDLNFILSISEISYMSSEVHTSMLQKFDEIMSTIR